MLDFGDISRASTDGNGDEFILNSYNTDGTIDGSQLKSDAEVPVVESTSFSQQLAVAAADAANMFQRMSSNMSVGTAPVLIQSEKEDDEDEGKDDDDSLVKGVDGVDTEDLEADSGTEDGAKQEDQKEEDQKEGGTPKEDKEDGGLIVGWPSGDEKDDDEAAKDASNGEDASGDKVKDEFSGDEGTKHADDVVQSDSDAAKLIDEKDDSVDLNGTIIASSADNTGDTVEEEDDEEDGSPFNVCTDLFRF